MINGFNYSLKNSLLWGNFAAHCKQATIGSLSNRAAHVFLAALEFLPIFGQITSLIELGVVQIKMKIHPDRKIKKINEVSTKSLGKKPTFLKGNKKWQSAELIAGNEISQYCKDYSKDQNLASAIDHFSEDVTGTSKNKLIIKQFVSESFAVNPSQLSIENVQPGLTSGLSGSPVFLVFKKDPKELCCVVKIYERSELAAQEINSLRMMKAKNLSHCHFPEVVGLGSFENQVFVAQSAAPGQSLDKEMGLIGELKSKEREHALTQVKNHLQNTAIALAELHSTGSEKTDRNISPKLNEEIHKLKESTKNQVKFLKQFNGLIERIEKWSNKVEFSKRGSLTHSDLHPGNIFVSKSEGVTLIDNDGIIGSTDQNLKPVKLASTDVANLLIWLPVMGTMNRLSEKEISDLQNTFLKKYRESRKDLDSSFENEVNFVKLNIALNFLTSLHHVLTNPKHPWAVLGETQIRGYIYYLTRVVENTTPK